MHQTFENPFDEKMRQKKDRRRPAFSGRRIDSGSPVPTLTALGDRWRAEAQLLRDRYGCDGEARIFELVADELESSVSDFLFRRHNKAEAAAIENVTIRTIERAIEGREIIPDENGEIALYQLGIGRGNLSRLLGTSAGAACNSNAQKGN